MEKINLKDLQEKLPYKWRVQSFSEYKPECSCVAYVDSRDVQNLLDKVVWPENWQDEYYQVKNTMLCKIGIKIGDEWVWKWDGGTETDIESEKGELSDSFKRAAVKWGVGRFLYDLDIVKIPANEVKDKVKKNYPYPVDKNGKRIWDITEYINNLNSKPLIDWNNAPIRDDVPQIPSKTTKPYITGLQVQTMLMDYKEGKIQVASVESLIEKAQKTYAVPQWAKDKFVEWFNSIKK